VREEWGRFNSALGASLGGKVPRFVFRGANQILGLGRFHLLAKIPGGRTGRRDQRGPLAHYLKGVDESPLPKETQSFICAGHKKIITLERPSIAHNTRVYSDLSGGGGPGEVKNSIVEGKKLLGAQRGSKGKTRLVKAKRTGRGDGLNCGK